MQRGEERFTWEEGNFFIQPENKQENEGDKDIPMTKNLFMKNGDDFLQMCFIRNTPNQQNLEKEKVLLIVDPPNCEEIAKQMIPRPT